MADGSQRTEADGKRRSGRSWILDAGIVLLILAAWLSAAWFITGGRRVAWYDTFRDMAWAENMCGGRIWADPVVAGQTWWYAPGGPLLVAGLGRLTGWAVADIYGTGPLWWNAWIPVAVYVLARVAWGRGTALLSLATVFLGSYWWYTHAAAPIPGIQAVTLTLLTLLCWHRSAASGRGCTCAIIAGVLLAACTWYHPVCGIMAAATILLHSVYDRLRQPAQPGGGTAAPIARARLRHMLVVAGIAGVLTLPLIVHLSAIHARNRELLVFSPVEIEQPEFYAQAHTPLIVPAALLGVWVVLRYAPETSWAVAYFLAALLLQMPAYLAHAKHLQVPYLLPHEMQWHLQLAEGLCAAVGIAWLARELAQAARKPRLALPATVVLGAISIGPALGQSLKQSEHFINLDRLLDETGEARGWIRSHTSLEDTIACELELGFTVVSGLTGRKCIAVSPGHMNPLPDVRRRVADVKERLSATDPTTAATVARRYGARYLLFAFASAEDAVRASAPCEACAELERCFTSGDGNTLIYSIRPEGPR